MIRQYGRIRKALTDKPHLPEVHAVGIDLPPRVYESTSKVRLWPVK